MPSSILIVLASYDYESLQITLKSLDHTLMNKEKVIIILNGNHSLNSRIVEYVAWKWSKKKPSLRFVIKPLSSPAEPFIAIKEVINKSEHFKEAKFICKIDDDIIPLKKDWLGILQNHYMNLSKNSEVGFVTGLINNNCWGFKELVSLYNKMEEYRHIHCYETIAGWEGSRIVNKGEIDDGEFGTAWQYPYIGRWIHEWTSLRIEEFIQKTKNLNCKLIPSETYYSIGCIFAEKSFWMALDEERYASRLDEKIIHKYCYENNKQKWAVMNQPFLHLFYNNHRIINADLITPICKSLSEYFNDENFIEDRIQLKEQFENAIQDQWQKLTDDITFTKDKLYNFLNNVELI